MTRTTKLTAALAAGTCLFTLAEAQAADLPPLYTTPLYESAPELQPVEIGNGWYLRGDVGYGFNEMQGADYREYRPDYVTYPQGFASRFTQQQYDTFGASHDGFDLDDSAEIGVGAGYQFTNYFRGDLTARYYKLEVDGNDRTESCYDGGLAQARFSNTTFDPALVDCRSATSSEADAIELMANAYVDLGTVAGFTPYVGGGVGAVQVKYDDFKASSNCSYGGGPCTPDLYNFDARYTGGDEWRFAYSLMAGVAYDVSKNLKIDVGYRYTDIDGGKMFDFADPSRIGASADDGGFERHTVSAGIRYSLW